MRCLTALLVLLVLSLVGCRTTQETAERPPKQDSPGDSQPSTAKLEFLSDILEFHQISLGISEEELKSMIAANDLLVRVIEEDCGKSYHVYRSDGENVIVMFREGKCSGVQRMWCDVLGVPTLK